MEATVEQDPQQAEKQKNDAIRSPAELFKFSIWVHAGLSAEDCPEAETGTCGNPLHFHAWCRLPNQFQHQDIRERAMAAKARRIRQLRDPDSDAHLILESDLGELRRDREEAVQELVAKDWWQRHLQAMGDIEEQEEYEHVERDRERFRELLALPEDKRPKDEFAELEKHFGLYSDAVEARRDELEKPVREAAEALDDGELIDAVRVERIANEGSSAFMDVYSRWEWFSGTYTTSDPVDRRRRFNSIEQLEDAAPEVVEALRGAFREMESSLQRGERGN